MADAKISELTAIDAVTGVDLLAVVDDPAGTPATKKATATQLKDFVVGAGSVSVASGKTLTASNTLTLAGTDGTTMTFPSTSATLARTDAAQTFTGAQTITGGTLNGTVLDITQTWGGTGTYTGLKYNVTDSGPSNASSLLMDLQVGGTSRFNVGKTGSLKLGVSPTGTNQAGTNVTIAGSQGTGTGAGGSIIFQVAPAGTTGTAQNALATALTIDSARTATFADRVNISAISVSGTYGSTGNWWNTNWLAVSGLGILFTDAGGNAILTRDAANTLALRNGTNAQAFRVYNTFTSSTNFERANIFWDSNVLKIGTEKGSGGGTARALELQTDGTTRLTIATTGAATFASTVTATNLATGRTLGRAFSPLDNQPPASNFATLDTRNSVATLDFDDATDEFAVFLGTIPEAATISSGLKVIISWAATSATSGDCVWGVQFAKLTGVDLDVFSFDTATTATTTTSGTSGVVNTTTITVAVADTDALAAGNCYAMQIYRDANAGGDTMTGDAEIIAVELQQVA